MQTQIELIIEERDNIAEGQTFGDVGGYTRLVGRVELAVDPAAPENQSVVDLDKAPRNAQGLVEFSTDLSILKPQELARGNQCLFFDFGNRGNKRALVMFNDAPTDRCNDPQAPEDVGTGFLMRRGYSVVWTAWEGDILPGDDRMTIQLPVATENGDPITGRVRSEFIVDHPGVYCLPLSGRNFGHSYPTASLDTGQATFTRRQYVKNERIPIAPDEWHFAQLRTSDPHPESGRSTDSAIVPADQYVYLPAGFEPGWIYELTYTAKDPLVMGLGYVAVRELVSFLKYRTEDRAGNPNPLRQEDSGMKRAHCFGRSQTGRAIRDFIYQGFKDTLECTGFDALTELMKLYREE